MHSPQKIKLSEQTAERLFERIVDERRYGPGEKLPNENELSAELGVSRTTLREAISSLVAQGVLQIQRGRGTFVAQELPDSSVNLSAIQNLHSQLRARDLLEMRLIFEPATVALACERASDEELEQIRRKAQRVVEVAQQGGDWSAADQEFHLAISRASHNEYMRRLYPIINNAVAEFMLLTAQNLEYIQHMAICDNEAILEFLLRRDAPGAREAMGIHMRHMLHALSD